MQAPTLAGQHVGGLHHPAGYQAESRLQDLTSQVWLRAGMLLSCLEKGTGVTMR